MQIRTLRNAIEFYAQNGNCDSNELDQIRKLIADCDELVNRNVDETDSVLAVPVFSLSDLLNIATYDTFGRMLKQNPDTTFEQYATAVRKLLLSDLTDSALELGYYFIRDLWNDNEHFGHNKPDGSFS